MVQIIDLNGQTVMEFQIQSSVTTQPINDLISGIYFIRVGQQTQKIIVR